jgi:pSer/pThr/pTyr-binding forkhead associated (FHA) protein
MVGRENAAAKVTQGAKTVNATFLVCVPAQGAKEPVRRAKHETLCIGRTRDGNDVGLPGDRTLSTHHCEFFFKDDAWHVRDLDTESGTFVDGERIQETPLVNGARIRLGVAEILYTPDVQTPQVVVMEDAAPRIEGPAVQPAGLSGNGQGEGQRFKIRPVAADLDEQEVQLKPAPFPGGSGRRARVREIE